MRSTRRKIKSIKRKPINNRQNHHNNRQNYHNNRQDYNNNRCIIFDDDCDCDYSEIKKKLEELLKFAKSIK